MPAYASSYVKTLADEKASAGKNDELLLLKNKLRLCT